MLGIKYAFEVQRWSHLVVMILAVLSHVANRPSAIPKRYYKEDEQESEATFYEVLHRDVGKNSFGRICETLSMFCYQVAVFLAQWTLVSSVACLIDPETASIECETNDLVGPRWIWLIIEACAFYCYMGATVVYIIYMSLRSTFRA